MTNLFKEKKIKIWLGIIILGLIIMIVWIFSLRYQFSLNNKGSKEENFLKNQGDELKKIIDNFSQEIKSIKILEKKQEEKLTQEQIKKIEEKMKEYNKEKENL